MMGKKRCFVVMGYGKKTDFATGRVIDLDKIYKYAIKPAAERAGLDCVRGDELSLTGRIDVSLFQELLSADIVIADLSAATLHVMYEVGVRHALRTRTTVLIAEEQLIVPWELRRCPVTRYKSFGDIVDVEEASDLIRRLSTVLIGAIRVAQRERGTDSPVYAELDIEPPSRSDLFPGREHMSGVVTTSLGTNLEDAERLAQEGQFEQAEAKLLELLAKLSKADPSRADVIHRLARVTHQGKAPNPLEAFERARTVIEPLDPHHSNDPVTLDLAAEIDRWLWQETRRRDYLDASIRFYERSFYVGGNYRTGINLAFVLDTRARIQTDSEERVADMVGARRVRNEVIQICDRAQRELTRDKALASAAELETARTQIYGVMTARAEALFGVGRRAEGLDVLEQAEAYAKDSASLEATRTKIEELVSVLSGGN